MAQLVKNPPAMQETWVRSLGWEDPLEKGKATHSSILAWRILWTVYMDLYSPWGCKESDMTEGLSLSKILVAVEILVAQMVKHLLTMQETWVWSLGWEDPLEKEMATYSSTLAWKIPWMEEPGRLQSMGSQKVAHDWATSLHFTSCENTVKGWGMWYTGYVICLTCCRHHGE